MVAKVTVTADRITILPDTISSAFFSRAQSEAWPKRAPLFRDMFPDSDRVHPHVGERGTVSLSLDAVCYERYHDFGWRRLVNDYPWNLKQLNLRGNSPHKLTSIVKGHLRELPAQRIEDHAWVSGDEQGQV